MLIIHPVIQLAATMPALYVLLLGVGLFRRLQMRQKTLFQWQRHVRLGTIALLLWLVGMALGLVMVKMYRHGLLITGRHGNRFFVILPLILFGLMSGWYMHKKTACPSPAHSWQRQSIAYHSGTPAGVKRLEGI